MTNTLRWLVALLMVAGGIWGFYFYQAQVLPAIRLVGLLVVLGLAAVVIATTARGRAFVEFMKAANVERQKVVWPTRSETVQTTIVVLVVVVAIGILIWCIDWIFAKAIALLVG